MDIANLMLAVFGSAAAAMTAVGGLAAWLGKVWSDRIAQQQKLAADAFLLQQKNAADRLLQEQKNLNDRLLQTQKLVGDIDADLRNRRITAYAPLWKLTSLLPQWPRNPDVSYEQLRAFSVAMRNWYYDVGGIYLSDSTRSKSYSPLQDSLRELIESGKSGPLSEADYTRVRALCSKLRTALTGDIESRREGPVP